MPPLVSAPGEGSAAAGAPLNYLESIDLGPGVLGAGGTFTSGVIDLGQLSQRIGSFSRWRVLVWADQPGTCTLQQSSDGVTFYPTQVNTYAAGGQATIYESLVVLRNLQVSYVNGATPQAQFRLVATLVAV